MFVSLAISFTLANSMKFKADDTPKTEAELIHVLPAHMVGNENEMADLCLCAADYVSLPQDLHQTIAAFLSISDGRKLASTSKSMRNILDNCPHHQSWKTHIFSQKFQLLLNNSRLHLDDILNLTWIMNCDKPIGHYLVMERWTPLWMIKDTNHIIEFVGKHPAIYKSVGLDIISKNSFIVFRITPVDVNWSRYFMPYSVEYYFGFGLSISIDNIHPFEECSFYFIRV